MRHSHAFTLIELLIVVVILGILASVALPMLTVSRSQARAEAFVANMRDLATVAQIHFEHHGELPPQGAGDRVPLSMLQTAGRTTFPLHTPLGGFWHVGKFENPERWGVGVWWPAGEEGIEAECERIDADIDDGDKLTGRFQCADGARYYWLIN